MKNKDKTWLDEKLSDFVATSLSKGFVPFFQFLDKDSFEVGEYQQSVLPMEETPIHTLQQQVKFYERMIERIRKKEGIVSEGEDVDKKLADLENGLIIKIIEFEKAITILKAEPQ